MKLHIENLLKIKETDINIEGITVIAGGNNSGKSTVGKALYAIFDSFYNMDKAIKDWKPNDAFRELEKHSKNLDLLCKKLSGAKRRKVGLAQSIQRRYSVLLALCESESDIYNHVKGYCAEHVALYGLEREWYSGNHEMMAWCEKTSSHMVETMLDYDSEYAEKHGVENVFAPIFSFDISKSIKKGEKREDIRKTLVSICVKSNEASRQDAMNQIVFSNGKIKSVSQEFSVNTRAIYIDSPRVLEKFYSISSMTQAAARKLIEDQLTPNKEVYSIQNMFSDMGYMPGFFGENDFPRESNAEMQKMDGIIERIEEELKKLVEGSLVFSEEIFTGLQFLDDYYENRFQIQNLSTGVKAIALLQLILHYRVLKRKSVLILDEPEINLHPEWQVAYAKYIVMLQKELDLHIVITTHSPFFLKALENAANEYGIWKKCHYYYAYNELGDARMECVDDDMEEIYSKMMMPLYNLLEDIQYKG